MRVAAVRVIQQALHDEGFNPGKIDGKTGKKTYAAVKKLLQRRTADVPDGWKRWSDYRQAVGCLQLLCTDQGLDAGKIDGYWGPQTEYAFDSLAHYLATGSMPHPWRDETPLDVNPNGWPAQDQAAVKTFYGGMGANLVRLELPYPHRLAWNLRKSVNSFSCHAKVHDSAQRALQRVFEHYGMERIKELGLDRWGGCYNKRKMRGGNRWSMHSWGIALDYDPERNQFKWGRDRAAFAHPDYDVWWRCWEEEGWLSLGRTKNFDWMHLQAAKL